MVVGRADDEDLNSVEDILEALQRLVAGSVLELSMTVVSFFFFPHFCSTYIPHNELREA